MDYRPLQFSPFQRKRLEALDVLPAQIVALETYALRSIALHARSPRLADARLILERLHADASRLLKGLKSMVPDQVPVELDSARLFLLSAHTEREVAQQAPSPIADSLLTELATFADTTERALAVSQGFLERDHSASPEPISLIARLMEEAMRGANPEELSVVPMKNLTRGLLREVANICYEAAGRDNADPERAIRAYFEQEAKTRDELIPVVQKLTEKHEAHGQECSAQSPAKE